MRAAKRDAGVLAQCLVEWAAGEDSIDRNAAARVVAETILGFRRWIGIKR